jgi:hypothetical protein
MAVPVWLDPDGPIVAAVLALSSVAVMLASFGTSPPCYLPMVGCLVTCSDIPR